jgi:predicted 3-demethylubiquinone-9 3-methyltransferase (glyoxalase superfamily)
LIRVLEDEGEVDTMQKITPFLWFDNQDEEAMKHISHYSKMQKPFALSDTGTRDPGQKGQS